nr:uncharacterized protein LOC109425766 [Aedes albopictus]
MKTLLEMFTITSNGFEYSMTPILRKKIAIGSTLVSAHKGQVRIQNSQTGRRRNSTLQVQQPNCEHGKTQPNREEMEGLQQDETQQRGSKRSLTERDDSEDEFYGFPSSAEQPLPASSELHPKSLQQQLGQHSTSQTSVLRRSSRLKKKKIDDAFVYTK